MTTSLKSPFTINQFVTQGYDRERSFCVKYLYVIEKKARLDSR